MDCVFCKIVSGSIPAIKLYESGKVLAFLDIDPLSKLHTLIIPKTHFPKLHDIGDDVLSEILPLAKRIALSIGCPDYNILQNNGAAAHQAITHAHFHLIPKEGQTGLQIVWQTIGRQSPEFLGKLGTELRAKIQKINNT